MDSFTSSYDKLSNVLKNKIEIAQVGSSFSAQEWVALWDTGATNSVITQKVVDALGLQPVGQVPCSTPQGSYNAWVYYIDVKLPSSVIIPKLQVTLGQPFGCDILVGMDIIGRGDFAVSNFEGRTIFTFRTPSLMTFDFVNKSYLEPIVKPPTPGRNSPCPCGSGKKYKQCCGR